jgi:hypothetical protein
MDTKVKEILTLPHFFLKESQYELMRRENDRMRELLKEVRHGGEGFAK